MMRIVLPFVIVAVAGSAQAQSVSFETQIWPILEARCIECHSAPHNDASGRLVRPKGRVELDSRKGIESSKGGELVQGGKPDDSLLYEVITLPADSEDRMPPAKKGTALTQEQTDLIKRWIDQGAKFGKWKGNEGEPEPAASGATDKPASSAGQRGKPKVSPLIALAKGLKPVDEAVLAKLAKGPFKVRSIGDNSPLLEVTSFGQTDAIDDQRLAELLPIAANIAELNLAATRITDKAGETLAKMSRLVNLDLRQTEVGNHGVAALAGCKELRRLNLYGSKVGDYGVSALLQLENLEELYLWQTEVSAGAVVRLQEALPGLRVVIAVELPEPMPDDGNNRRRRR